MVSCIVFSLSNIYNPWEVQVKHTYKSHSVHELQVCNSVSVSIPETLAASLLRCCTLNSRRFSSVQLLSHIRLFVTPWTAACQASLSIKNSWSLLKLMSIESVVPSNHFILCSPFSSCLQSFPASGSFPVTEFFVSGSQSIGVSVSASVPPMIFRTDFL